MGLLGLAAVIGASLAGPALSWPRKLGVPVVVGELAIGVALGRTGARLIDAHDPILTFLALAGFALVMMVAGSHVPVRTAGLRTALVKGMGLALAAGLIALPLAAALSHVVHTGHTALYVVLIASSSAALVLPVVDEVGLKGPRVLTMLAQVAIADSVGIVALPLAEQPARAGRAGIGALAVLGAAALLFLVLASLRRHNRLEQLHRVSASRNFGLELRLSLLILFALAGLAVHVYVSVMLAGFAVGLVLSGLGEPRRLTFQLFAVTDGFLGPVFFVWLGASLDFRALGAHPRLMLLTVGIAAATLFVHGLARLVGQPLTLALLPAAQLGVPVAAATIGEQNHLLGPGEGAAIVAAALITVASTAIVAAVAGRSKPTPS